MEDVEASFNPLPSFPASSEATLSWGDVDGKTFSRALNGIYDEAGNKSFQSPFRQGWNRELSQMFRAYADCSALESVAVQAAMVMPTLLLLRPHPQSKAKDHIHHLEQLWGSG